MPKVAMPEAFRVPLPRTVAPSLKSTEPVGISAPSVKETFPVNVTVCPCVAGLRLEVTTISVGIIRSKLATRVLSALAWKEKAALVLTTVGPSVQFTSR